ncbi:protein of unknown function [Aminobacter niigataensis]|nr:protein of unknown function [Aminobacter niigataensis]
MTRFDAPHKELIKKWRRSGGDFLPMELPPEVPWSRIVGELVAFRSAPAPTIRAPRGRTALFPVD